MCLCGMLTSRQFPALVSPDAQLVRHCLELAVARFRTDKTIFRMVREYELHDCTACIEYPRVMCSDHHSIFAICCTRRCEVATALYLHHTDAAPGRPVLYIKIVKLHPAQSRNVNPSCLAALLIVVPFGTSAVLLSMVSFTVSISNTSYITE